MAAESAEQLRSLSRWRRTLTLAEYIATAEGAIADGRLAPETGARLLAEFSAARLALLGTKVCRCGDRPCVSVDPDDDLLRLSGGFITQVSTRLNGYDAARAAMESNGRCSAKRRRMTGRGLTTCTTAMLHAERVRDALGGRPTFERFDRVTETLTGPERLAVFSLLPEDQRRCCWLELRAEVDRERELAVAA